MMKIVIFSNQDLETQHTYLGLRVSSPVISIHDFYFFYQDDGLKNIPDTPKCSRNAARRELKVLGISEFMCVCCGQTVYSENFHPSACRLPRTFSFPRTSSENILNFNTTRTDWFQEVPGKFWEKTSEYMFYTPFV